MSVARLVRERFEDADAIALRALLVAVRVGLVVVVFESGRWGGLLRAAGVQLPRRVGACGEGLRHPIFVGRPAHADERAAPREIDEHGLERLRSDLPCDDEPARSRATAEALDDGARRLGRGAEQRGEDVVVELHAVGERQPGAAHRVDQGPELMRAALEERTERLLEHGANRHVTRDSGEASGRRAEELPQRGVAAHERPVRRGPREVHEVAVAEVDLEEIPRVTHGQARVRRHLRDRAEHVLDADALERAAHLAARAQLRLEASPRSQHITHAREDLRAARLLAQVAARAGVQIAHALDEVFLPRQEDDGDALERGIPLDLAAEREAVDVRHEDVADDDVDATPAEPRERLTPVRRLEDLGARLAEQAGEEPEHGGVIVDDEDVPTIERDFRRRFVSRRVLLVDERHHRGAAPTRQVAEAHAPAGASSDVRSHARDRRPSRCEHLGAVAERNGDVAARLDRADEPIADLRGEPVRDLRERDGAERFDAAARSSRADELGDRAHDRLWVDGLRDGVVRAERARGDRVDRRARRHEHDDRDEVGERIVAQPRDEVRAGARQRRAIDEHDVRRARAREAQRLFRRGAPEQLVGVDGERTADLRLGLRDVEHEDADDGAVDPAAHRCGRALCGGRGRPLRGRNRPLFELNAGDGGRRDACGWRRSLRRLSERGARSGQRGRQVVGVCRLGVVHVLIRRFGGGRAIEPIGPRR